MRIDLASNVKVGDIVYNCFMEPLVVGSISQGDTNLVFTVIDTGLNAHAYSYEDVYLEDFYGESDEEKSWIEWAKDNKDFFDTFDHIEASKEIYKIGFAHGFEYKRRISFEELMQK